MSLKLAYEIYYIELFHILSIIIFVAVNYGIYLKSRKNSLLYHYMAVQLLILIWLVAKVFKTVSPNESIRWFFIVCQYFGNCYLSSTFLMFSYVYAHGRPLQRHYAILLNLLPTFFFISMATNPYHMLFYSYYDFYKDSFGPLFYAHQTYSYSTIIIGLIICSKNFRQQFKTKKMQSLLLSVAIFVPLVVNIFYILKLFKVVFGFRPLFDITPITCNLSLIFFALAIFKYQFLDIIPRAHKKVLNQLLEGAVIFDTRGRIIDYNDAFAEMHRLLQQAAAPKQQDSSLIWLRPLLFSDLKSDIALELPIIADGETRTYFLETMDKGSFQILLQPFSSGKEKIGMALLFIDITKHIQIINELTAKNTELLAANQKLEERSALIRSLSITRLRNHLAREVHDILGHSVVLGISVLEVAALFVETQPLNAQKKVSNTLAIFRGSLQELQSSLLGSTSSNKKTEEFLQSIRRMSNKFTSIGVEIDIQFQGTAYELSPYEAESIYRLCQEGVTNSVRHGKATQITIILRCNSAGYEVYLIDNGQGCDGIEKGYGLLGMEERINNLQGTLKYGSPENSGFCIHAVVPRSIAR